MKSFCSRRWIGNHIHDPEGYWGYLKRKLSLNGGILQEKAPSVP
jgi:hypothetical protein